MDKEGLRRGFTTGSCASAAAKGAALVERRTVDEVTITLPRGEHVRFELRSCTYAIRTAPPNAR